MEQSNILCQSILSQHSEQLQHIGMRLNALKKQYKKANAEEKIDLLGEIEELIVEEYTFKKTIDITLEFMQDILPNLDSKTIEEVNATREAFSSIMENKVKAEFENYVVTRLQEIIE